MSTVAFRSEALPVSIAAALQARLVDEHARQPFPAADPRDCVRRVRAIVSDIGVSATVYRGGLDLRGSEVDHLWLDVSGRVVDVAFPLFVEQFVAVLRDYVAGHAEAADVGRAADRAGVESRVLGRFPESLAYRGSPVWSSGRR